MPEYREGVVIPNRNNLYADVISKDGDLYTIRIRGSPDKETINMNKKHLVFLLADPRSMYEETLRMNLYGQLSEGNVVESHIRQRVLGHELGDECSYLLSEHTTSDTLDGLPTEVEEKLLALLVEQYYFLGGSLCCSGRSLTSYCKTLQPFVKVEIRDGKALIKTGTPNNGQKIVSWFESLVASNPLESASLFFRVVAYAQFRMDNVEPSDSLLDVFYIVFIAIQILMGKGSQDLQSCKPAIYASIEAAFQQYGTDFSAKFKEHQIPTIAPSGLRMNAQNLIWCLCMLFLDLGITVRDKIPVTQYDNLLPRPYKDTIEEQGEIANACIHYRDEHPASYLRAFTMIMDVKDLASPSFSNILLHNAFKVAKVGKEIAERGGHSLYLYLFLIIEAFWVPTSFWPHHTDSVTYRDIENRLIQAQKLKDECKHYEIERSFLYGKSYKGQLEAFLKSVFKSNSISDRDGFLVSSIQCDPYTYCSSRFKGASYYKFGGKFDRLATQFTCDYCSKGLTKRLSCARCEKAKYCDRECQKKHWKNGHKEICKKIE
eukprot:scaffold233_cov198-Chaetoceros_neogracile.AAC.3